MHRATPPPTLHTLSVQMSHATVVRALGPQCSLSHVVPVNFDLNLRRVFRFVRDELNGVGLLEFGRNRA